jgi:nucleotide-binding universal stress UspA family protein
MQDSRSGEVWPRSVLLVTDGSRDGEAAIVAAAILAERSSAVVEAAVIVAPRIPVPSCGDPARVSDHWEPSERREAAHLIRAARRQYRQALPDRDRRADWSRCVAVGDPGATIVRLVEERTVDLVVIGLGQQEPLDEAAGGRVAVCAARHLRVPLYAVAPGHSVAKTALVVSDGGEGHQPTLQAARACLPADGRVRVVSPDAADVDRVLQLADEIQADLIAVSNSHDAGPVRTLLPSIAEPLLARARCSVLVVPR